MIKFNELKNSIVLILIIATVIALGLELYMRVRIPLPAELGDSRIINLDARLAEVSGLTYSNELGLLAINDEKGIIFSLDAKKGEILDKWSFSDPNDFEGIAAVGNHVYVIDSSGNLYRYNSKSGKTKKIKTNLKHKNDIEGLCYNAADSSLLIAAKGQLLPDKNKKAFGSIFKYNIKKGKLNNEVFIKIRMEEVEKALGKKIKGGFGTSGITTLSNEIILVSHHAKALLVYNQNKELKSAYNLNSEIYNQPEGITFIDGVLVISNEKGSTQSSTLIFHCNLEL